jgi:hypothetical protein
MCKIKGSQSMRPISNWCVGRSLWQTLKHWRDVDTLSLQEAHPGDSVMESKETILNAYPCKAL